MSLHHSDPTLRERAIELLAERAIFGLDGESSLELDRLLLKCPDIDESALDLAAAALEPLATTMAGHGPKALNHGSAHSAIPTQMPTALRDLLIGSGEAWVRAHAPVLPVTPVVPVTRSESGGVNSSVRPPKSPGPRAVGEVAGGGTVFGALTIGGWIAAAAALIFAVSAWLPSFAKRQTPEAARAELIAQAPDLLRAEWAESSHVNVDPFLCGDVVWSNELQRGFMAITGLLANNPSEYQYQLWIFDADRPGDYPIDGGVFDVPASDQISMTVIPIDPKLLVGKPSLFAVTVEPPGGVVVSDRNIALTARVN